VGAGEDVAVEVEISSFGLCEGVREVDVSRRNSSGSEGDGEGG
jgi:hypothetical protein